MSGSGPKRTGMLKCSAVVVVSLLWWSSFASAQLTIVPYQDTGYKYLVVSHGADAGFEQPGFDDSAWPVGDAAFGEDNGFNCPISSTIATDWPINTDILLRKIFVLPPGATNVNVSVAIDNDVQVFINGHDISGGVQTHEGCATRGSFNFPVDPSFFTSGDNLVAVRGIDRGGADLIDLQITANPSGACSLSPFNGKLRIDPDGGVFYLSGGFTVSGGCSINPPREDVLFSVGDFSVDLPPGSFFKVKTGYVSETKNDGVFLCIYLKFTKTPGKYQLFVYRKGGIIDISSSPVPVSLSIDDVSGSTDMSATFF